MSRDQNGNMWNNPFMYLIWLSLFNRGGLFGGNGENVLSEQIADNNNFANLANTVNAAASSAAEKAINAGLLNNRDVISKFQECCCENKVLSLQNQAATMARIDQLANGVTQGFASIGFNQEKNTNAILQGQKDQTQTILGALSNHWTQDLRDRVFELSQQAQTASIVSQLKTT